MPATSSDYLLYDGECPFCSEYVRMHRLKAAGVNLQLMDARQHPDLVSAHASEGRDINDGMILKFGDGVYYGGDVMHKLALMSGPTIWINRLFSKVFAHRWLARLLYPALRTGRNATLRLMGRRKMDVVRS